MLAFGALPLPYGYYQLLRICVTGFFVWATVVSSHRSYPALPYMFLVLALLFNPIVKVTFIKPVWAAVDLVVAVIVIGVRSRIRQ